MSNPAVKDFWEYCKSNRNDEAKQYVLSRHFGLDDFEWGYFPHNEQSTEILNANPEAYEELTIGYKDWKGEYHSRFFDRLVFPIKDMSGEVIAVAGRPISEPAPKPKYYNSKYGKKYNLFYLDQAIPHIRKHGFVLVCEGYFATLRLHHTCGIKNVVATCGTLFTREQLDCLSRYTINIGFLRDRDEAGEKSTQMASEDVAAHNKRDGISGGAAEAINLFEIKLDTVGDDPDDYIIKYGREKFIELVKKQRVHK